MLIFKKISLGLCKFLVFLCFIILLVALFVKATIGNQQAVTSSLEKSKIYSSIAKEFKNQLTKTNQANLPDNPILTAVADQTITEEQVQKLIEPMIAQVYDWLNGKTPDLIIKVDTDPIKDNFKQTLTTELNKYVHSLPVCTATDARPQDYVSAKCLPAGVDRNMAVGILEQQLLGNNLDQFSSGEINFFDSSSSKQSNQNDPIKQFPKNYQFLIKSPPFIIVIILLLFAIIFVLSKPKYLALRSYFGILTIFGIVYISSGLFILLIIKSFIKPAIAQLSPEIVGQINFIIKDLISHASPTIIFIGIGLLVGGFISLIIYLLINRKVKNSQPPTPTIPNQTYINPGLN